MKMGRIHHLRQERGTDGPGEGPRRQFSYDCFQLLSEIRSHNINYEWGRRRNVGDFRRKKRVWNKTSRQVKESKKLSSLQERYFLSWVLKSDTSSKNTDPRNAEKRGNERMVSFFLVLKMLKQVTVFEKKYNYNTTFRYRNLDRRTVLCWLSRVWRTPSLCSPILPCAMQLNGAV